MTTEALQALRRDYQMATLNESTILKSPFDQFKKWFEEAQASLLPEPNAMVLSTQSLNGGVSSRTVLLKGLESGYFLFFTNYGSKKGEELATNPNATILFPWYPLERQVIVTGKVSKVSRADSETYFHSRPRNSQIGAHVSRQSEVIASREALENKQRDVEVKYKDVTVPLPEYWGGYQLKPETFEFWQGRSSRLHDRLFFEIAGTSWKISRLSP